MLSHPKKLIRDFETYDGYTDYAGRTIPIVALAKIHFNVELIEENKVLKKVTYRINWNSD